MLETCDVSYITAAELAELLQGPEAASTVVVDVRDEDFTGYGGHIRGCVNLPSDRFYPDSAADKVVNAVLQSAPKRVVFHCMLSQQRGPFAAGRFAARLGAASSPATAVLPEVLVLQGGWKAWRRAYGDNAALTEGAE